MAVELEPPEDVESRVLPLLSTFVCAVVNIPFLEETPMISFVLDIPTVADISAGEIREWSDPRIRKANPNLPW